MLVHSIGRAADRGLVLAVRACRFAGVLALAAMSILVVLQIAGRNFFDLGLPWADELARFACVALVFLCVPSLAIRGQMVAVDLLKMALPDRSGRYLSVLVDLAVLTFAALTLYGFHSFLGRAGKFTTPATGMSNWIFYAPALAGFGLLALISIARICRHFSAGTGTDGTADHR